MTSTSPQYEVRLVGDHELEAVRQVSTGVFNYTGKTDHDYLVPYFPRWASSSNHFMMGLFRDGQLVAFACDSLLDEGKTIFRQGLRVSSAHRGQRLVLKLAEGRKRFREEVIFPRFPVERIREARACHDKNPKKMIEKLMAPNNPARMDRCISIRSGWTSLREQNLPLRLGERISPGYKSSVRMVSPTEALEFANREKSLFSSDTLQTDWEALDLTPQNFHLLYYGGLGNFERRFGVIDDENGNPRALGVFGMTKRGEGVALNIDLFSHSLDDALTLAIHALQSPNRLGLSPSLPPADHVWVWCSYELEQTFKEQFSGVLQAIQDDPTYYFFHCAYMEAAIKPSSKI